MARVQFQYKKGDYQIFSICVYYIQKMFKKVSYVPKIVTVKQQFLLSDHIP